MSYVDFAFYKDTFLGVDINEKDFPRLALRASQFLDYYTQGRAEKNSSLVALKMACCAVAEVYAKVGDKNGIASESVGSYSVSYSGETDAGAAMATAARQHLANTGLLYRGRC